MNVMHRTLKTSFAQSINFRFDTLSVNLVTNIKPLPINQTIAIGPALWIQKIMAENCRYFLSDAALSDYKKGATTFVKV